ALGYQVSYALSWLKTDRMLALVVVIALLGWLLARSLVALRDRLVYWEKLETFYVWKGRLVKLALALLAVFGLLDSIASAAEPPLIRFGRGFAAEEQVWLMSARPDLTPSQGKKYQLKQILFQANPERFQAYLAGELDGGTAPGLAVIFARAQGVDMKIVASICLEAAGKEWFSTTYMVKDDWSVSTAKEFRGGSV